MDKQHTSPGELPPSRILGGAVWLFSSHMLSRVARVGVLLVTAALLLPQEYAIIVLSITVITIAQVITEFGLWQAVVHRKDPDSLFLNTAFTTNVFVGFAMTTAIFLVAPWIGNWYGSPEMTTVLRVMGFALIMDGIFYVPDGLLRKQLSFKSRVLPEIAGSLGGAVVIIILLLLGIGILSYAVGFVVESITRCVLTVRKISWRPRIQWSWVNAKAMIAYGRHIVGADLARYLSSNVDYLVIGSVLGAKLLGFYTLAFNLANLPVLHFAYIISRILFPAFVIMQEDRAYARRAYLKIIRILGAVVVPVLVVVALLAPLLITVVFGQKWQPAVFPLQAMVVAAIFRSISIPSEDMLRAIGRPQVPFKIHLLEVVVISAAVLMIAYQGINAVSLAMTTIFSVTSGVITVASCRAIGLTFRELGRALTPSVLLTASGAGAVLCFRYLNLEGFFGGGMELVVLVAAAGVAIAISLLTFCRTLLRDIVALAASVRNR